MKDCIGNEINIGDFVFANGSIWQVKKLSPKMVRAVTFADSTKDGWKKSTLTSYVKISDPSKQYGYRYEYTAKEKLVYPYQMVKLQEEAVMMMLISMET